MRFTRDGGSGKALWLFGPLQGLYLYLFWRVKGRKLLFTKLIDLLLLQES